MNSYNDCHSQLITDEINKQSDRDTALRETHDLLQQMYKASEEESKINKKRFWINFFIALIAAIAAVISAIVCIISFVS